MWSILVGKQKHNVQKPTSQSLIVITMSWFAIALDAER